MREKKRHGKSFEHFGDYIYFFPLFSVRIKSTWETTEDEVEVVLESRGSLQGFLSKMKVYSVQRKIYTFFTILHLPLNVAAIRKYFFFFYALLSCLPLPELSFPCLFSSLLPLLPVSLWAVVHTPPGSLTWALEDELVLLLCDMLDTAFTAWFHNLFMYLASSLVFKLDEVGDSVVITFLCSSSSTLVW